jgi:hypothetical protein
MDSNGHQWFLDNPSDWSRTPPTKNVPFLEAVKWLKEHQQGQATCEKVTMIYLNPQTPFRQIVFTNAYLTYDDILTGEWELVEGAK